MNIKEALTLAYAHMSVVKLSGEENMEHMIEAMKKVKAVKDAIENAEREAVQNENGKDEDRDDG